MNKYLFRVFLLICFITTAFFTTGCNNGDDYDDWRRKFEYDSLLLKIGVSPSVSEERAVTNPKTIIVAGVTFSYLETSSGLDFYYAYLPRTLVDAALNTLKFQINNLVFYVDASFFKNALHSTSAGNQPNAVLSFDAAYNIISAEINGAPTAKPNKWNENPDPDPDPTASGTVKLSISGDTVTAVVPSEFGNVTSYYSWEVRLTSTKSQKSRILYSGQYQDMYNISNNGNTFYFTITEKGKSNLTPNTTYMGTLRSLVIYTDKYANTPILLNSNTAVYYTR